MIKKNFQKIFKSISYGIFFKVYGKIKVIIKTSSDNRIKTSIVNIDKSLTYKIYQITNGRLYTDRIQDTAVILDNKIIDEASFQLRNKKDGTIYNSTVNDNIVFRKGTPRLLRKLNGNVLSLLTGGGGNDNYWHWLYDVLPRLALCSKEFGLEKIDYFIFPSTLKKFQQESLDCLNIKKNKRLSSEKYRHISANKLILTDHPVVVTGNHSNDIQNVPKWILTWLRENFLNPNILINKSNPIKIYIDRSDAYTKKQNQRLLANENEIKKYLLEKDFVPVKLHKINFKEQVNLFYNAECIIGLHGAGFANLAFCKPGTKVIEMRSSNAGFMYENLAKKNDLNYHSIIIEAKQIHNFNYPNQQGSIEVPISSIKKIIDKY